MNLEQFIHMLKGGRTEAKGLTIFTGKFPIKNACHVNKMLPLDFIEQNWLDDPHRNVWLSNSRQVIVTFNGGEVTVQRFTRAVDYRNEVAKQEALYCELQNTESDIVAMGD